MTWSAASMAPGNSDGWFFSKRVRREMIWDAMTPTPKTEVAPSLHVALAALPSSMSQCGEALVVEVSLDPGWYRCDLCTPDSAAAGSTCRAPTTWMQDGAGQVSGSKSNAPASSDCAGNSAVMHTYRGCRNAVQHTLAFLAAFWHGLHHENASSVWPQRARACTARKAITYQRP